MSVYSTKKKDKVETPVEESGNILEMIVENAEDDLKMFNSVITLDFLEAYNEAGYSVVTEAEEGEAKGNGAKAIINKIGEKVNELIKKISAFIDKWITKLINVIANDKKLYDQYKNAFMNNAKGKTVKYRPAKSLDKAFAAYDSKTKEVSDKAWSFANDIMNAKSSDDVAPILEDIKKYFNGLDAAADSNIVFTGDESDEYTLTDDDVAVIDADMKDTEGFRKKANDLKKNLNKETLASVGQIMATLTKSLKNDDQGMDLAKSNACYTIAGMYSTYATKLTSSFVNQINKAVANARRVFIQVAKAGTSTSENQEEVKAECAALGLASDLYMEQVLLCAD